MRDRRKNILYNKELVLLSDRIIADGGTLEAINCTGLLSPDFSMAPIATKAGKLYSKTRLINTLAIGYPESVDDFTVERATTPNRVDSNGDTVVVPVDVPVLDWDNGAGGVLACPRLIINGDKILGAGDSSSFNSQ